MRYKNLTMEVVNNKTKLSLSPRMIIPVQTRIETITLKKLSDIPDFNIVTVSAKIAKLVRKLRLNWDCKLHFLVLACFKESVPVHQV